ncbi:MAG: Gfo/Idh/MocA family oxidoreductase [Alphaproteobacteria bacterium]|nr:Gfo/Idh/MocA family oxidoreductase [Alphaproteobacteria bacterium]
MFTSARSSWSAILFVLFVRVLSILIEAPSGSLDIDQCGAPKAVQTADGSHEPAAVVATPRRYRPGSTLLRGLRTAYVTYDRRSEAASGNRASGHFGGGNVVIRAAIVGLGWWGKTLVESVRDGRDIRFVAGATRTPSPEIRDFAKAQGFDLRESYEDLLRSPDVDTVVLATPHSMHVPQIVAAARARKHVFCEKPFALTKADAEKAVAATQKAGVTLGLGYNRRFHPTMTDLRERVKTGALGTILHFEGTMTFPNALSLKPGQWRASRAETPCGGLTPMGVHFIDAAIDLFGAVDEVFCTSFRRAVQIDADDTTSILFRMKDGMSAYLGTMTATAGTFRLQVYGSNGWIRIDGMTHVAGASSEERRNRLFGNCTFQPIKGAAETWQAETYDVSRAALEAFARAAEGGPTYPISLDEMVHGAAVTEAIVKSATSGKKEKVA